MKKDFVGELQDLRYLDWSESKLSSGTLGCVPVMGTSIVYENLTWWKINR